MFGLLTQWGLRGSLTTLRKPGAIEQLAERGVPAVWIRSIRTLLEVVDDLDRQITQIEPELRPIARTDPRVRLLITIPGLGYLLALTIVAEIGDISRFPSARKLIGYAGLAPTIKQSGQSSRRADLKGRPDAALGRDRSRATRLAANQPLEPALHQDQGPAWQGQPGQERRRPQGPDRVLARPRTRTRVQASRTDLDNPCPGKLHGDLTARRSKAT